MKYSHHNHLIHVIYSLYVSEDAKKIAFAL